MESVFFGFIFFFGLMVGSFLNVVIIRLREEETLGGRSHCSHCKRDIAWYDNIPIVSFLALLGKCRRCTSPISIQYPLVEIATAVLFTVTVWGLLGEGGISTFASLSTRGIIQILGYFYFVATLIIIFVYDLRWYLILDSITLPAILITFFVQSYLGFSSINLLLAGAIGGGFFLLQFLISRGRWIGGGDIRLGLLMGVMLGFPNILASLMIAYLMGGIFGMVLMVSGKKRFGDKLPFGTFLSLAAVITLLYGDAILTWYLYSFLR